MKRQLGVKSAHAAKKTSSILVQNAPMMLRNASCSPIGEARCSHFFLILTVPLVFVISRNKVNKPSQKI